MGWPRGHSKMSARKAPARPMEDRPVHGLRVCILHIPDCPNVEPLRTEVKKALASVGVSAVIEEVEGPYPSPTLLINGIEVTGQPLDAGPACRLDLPTIQQIVSAILTTGMDGTDLITRRRCLVLHHFSPTAGRGWGLQTWRSRLRPKTTGTEDN